MRFTTLVCAMLLGIATPGSAGGVIDVFTDYEDIDIVSNVPPYIPKTQAMGDYRQLDYVSFRAYHVAQYSVTNTTPIANQSAVGFNESEIFTGFPTAYQPKSASFGCVTITKLIFGISIQCTVRVTAYSGPRDDIAYPTTADCKYSGVGNLTKCDFPEEWRQVSRLLFEITQFNASVSYPGDDRRVDQPIEDYNVQFLLDDFSATYQCDQGGDAETGLCAESGYLRENELRK